MDFNKVINRWLDQYPKGQVPMEASARIAALKDLFERFKSEGFPMEYFNNTVKGKITSNCINPNHPNKSKKRKWIEYVAKHMEIALYAIYDDTNVRLEDNDMLAPAVSDKDMTVNIEEDLKEHNAKVKAPKTPKVEYFSENAPKTSIISNNVIDPEMAKLLGIDNE